MLSCVKPGISSSMILQYEKSIGRSPKTQDPGQCSQGSNHHEESNVLLRPDVGAPWCCWGIAVVRLADRGIFMLLLPSQATEERIHPKNTWASVGVDNMLD
jgi:hypothetical protein